VVSGKYTDSKWLVFQTPARLADGLEQWKCSSFYKMISPKKFGSPALLYQKQLRQLICQKLEYIPAKNILQA
jgi:hypothetical protein